MNLKNVTKWMGCAAVAVLCTGGGVTRDGYFAQAAETVSSGGQPMYRRLSAEQYKQIIADVFGPTIKLGGGFEPDQRADGLLAVGAGRVSVSATGLSQYDNAARTIAAQIVGDQYRDGFVPCKPANKTQADNACAAQFVTETGRLLFRRPLDTDEIAGFVEAAAGTTKTMRDFYAGLGTALSVMLSSPQFLFREEIVEPDPEAPGQVRLNAYSKAARLSFLLWNSAPDKPLLAAAESGELHTATGLQKQVDRMMMSRRLQTSVRAFFTDMLGFDAMPALSKDAMLYPRFSSDAARDGQEQTLRTIVDHLVVQKGDYRDLFTTRKTFLTPVLGRVYGLPIPRTTPNGAADVWRVHEYPEGDPRVGILTHISFVALHSHPFRNSATLRGKALREVFLCQKVPDPPGDVQFTIVQDTSNPVYKTARDRLNAHATEAMCAGCHKIMDPIGLAFEKFDSAGYYRTTENGALINTSGEVNGKKFTDTTDLGRAIRELPALTNCLVTRTLSYAVGRPPAKEDAGWVRTVNEDFAKNGYRFPELLREIAMSPEFYRVAAPK